MSANSQEISSSRPENERIAELEAQLEALRKPSTQQLSPGCKILQEWQGEKLAGDVVTARSIYIAILDAILREAE